MDKSPENISDPEIDLDQLDAEDDDFKWPLSLGLILDLNDLTDELTERFKDA